MGYELDANKYNYKCLMMSVFAIEFIWLMNEIGLFVVRKSIVRAAVIPITVIALLVIILLNITGLKHKWVKFVIISTEIIIIHIMGMMLTYHVVIFFGIPFLMAAHYQNKKMAFYTLVMSLIGMVAVIWVGYSYGVCDLNMVAFTKDTVDNYGELAIIPIKAINDSIRLKVMAYFFLPRAVVLILFAFMTLSIAESGRVMQQRQTEAEIESTFDKMTGVYNKNKYLKMIKTTYPKIKSIGVIYFDVNGLKMINDTMGHDKGDLLISTTARTLSYFKSDKIDVYRMGGDEFAMVVKDAVEDDIKNVIRSWRNLIDTVNTELTDFKCQVAVGYSIGDGIDIENLVEKADNNMYENKTEMKENR